MTKPLILFIYGDSLGMPRFFNNIYFDKTYPELIQQWYKMQKIDQDVYLYNRSQGGVNIEFLHEQFVKDSNYFGDFGEKVLILQCGVVDCAPRPIPAWLRRKISKLPGIVRTPIVEFLHNNRSKILNTGVKWKATFPYRFKSIYRSWLRQAVNEFSRVYIFNILPTIDSIEKHSPGFGRSIKEYNNLIGDTVSFVQTDNLCLIDVYKLIMEDNYNIEKFINNKDGHHLTIEGHKLFRDLFIEREKDFVAKKIKT